MSILDRVTITGADDSVEPSDLVYLSQDYPFVEWGILVSASNDGSPRYPTRDWRDQLASIFDGPLALSVHVQGRWLRDLLIGDQRPFIGGVGSLLARSQRIQLNFHGSKLSYDGEAFLNALLGFVSKQFLFQHDGCDGGIVMRMVTAFGRDHLDCVAFYDTSHGAGILPREWPKPVSMGYVGFAGGLGPENLAEQIPLIAAAAYKNKFWIDMETRVRSDGGRAFDLEKVERALEVCAPFIGKEL